jgi:hypothetical protein
MDLYVLYGAEPVHVLAEGVVPAYDTGDDYGYGAAVFEQTASVSRQQTYLLK